MRIDHLTVQNFLGVQQLDAQLGNINLFVGANAAGKSSLHEAIRMALRGESVRVTAKADYGFLVREGKETAHLSVLTNQGTYNLDIAGSGKTSGLDKIELPGIAHALDMSLFSRQSSDDRRSLLLDLCRITTHPDEIVTRLVATGCDAVKAEELKATLAGGFNAAAAEAEDRKKQARADWKAITGETYGEKKAGNWKPKAGDKPLACPACGANVSLVGGELVEWDPDAPDPRIQRAKDAHNEAQAWGKLAEQLSPGGIPADLLEPAIQQFNGALLASCNAAKWWGQVTLTSDMSVRYSNRPYGLLSESEKWRADAMLTHAIVTLAAIDMITLDRFDVISPQERGPLLDWCDALAKDNTQLLLFGTLRERPKLNGINVVWVEGGRIA